MCPSSTHFLHTFLGLYLHPLEEGEYHIFYRSKDKPYRYGYCVIGRDMDTWISRPATSEEVLQILENGMTRCQLPPVFLHGALHWLESGSLGLQVLLFDAITCLFRFLKEPPPAGNRYPAAAYHIGNTGSQLE